MTSRRQIAPISLGGAEPLAPPTDKPELTWIAPTELLVDEEYQRNPSERTSRLVRQIVANFDWRRFGAVVCAWTDDGLEVLDGQHRAIAAASHPAVTQIPVVIVDAKEKPERAAAFIGHNRDRTAVTPTQLHAAAVVAGNAEALAIDRVCSRAGIRVRKALPATVEPGDTIAVTAIGALVRRRGEDGARLVLEVLASAECAPITGTQIKAVDLLLNEDEYRDLDVERLPGIIQSLASADHDARIFSAAHPSVPLWKALAIVWFKSRRRRPDVAAAERAGAEQAA